MVFILNLFLIMRNINENKLKFKEDLTFLSAMCAGDFNLVQLNRCLFLVG